MGVDAGGAQHVVGILALRQNEAPNVQGKFGTMGLRP